jgi:hypothetical protein
LISVPARQINEDEIDNTIAPIRPHFSSATPNLKKGQVHQVEWDDQLEQMSREKTTADAARGEERSSRISSHLETDLLALDLKARFRAKSAYLGASSTSSSRNTAHHVGEKKQDRSTPLHDRDGI